MGISVRGAALARPFEICGDGAGSSPQFWKQKFNSPAAVGPYDLPDRDCARSLTHVDASAAAQRRTAALDASLDQVLIAASARASEQLKTTWPKLSAATLGGLFHAIPLLFGLLAIVAIFNGPGTIVLSFIVALPAAFRQLVVEQKMPAFEDLHAILPDMPDEEFPVYSVIVPLRNEAGMVDQLLSAIERLDYPAEKLDVIVAVEADAHDTRAAITARKHRIPITVIPVPPGEPRTKPKALSVALPFARGTFTVIYDAEDLPERNQLRRALEAFRLAGDDLACVQAKLCIHTKTTWLARYFSAEYAGHFDLLLPRLAALQLPLPLGGSSNHFRTATLREVGGWDPYNVTEDADLGMRLARFGYRCGVINSTTHEEAPADIHRWLGQRTRWSKGWMQTWLVHMREPRRLLHQLGPRGFVAFQLIVGGNALAALAHPLFIVKVLYELFALGSQGCDVATVIQMALCFATLVLGYFVSARLGWLGLSLRGEEKRFFILKWMPVHWLLLSLAGWCAAIQIITAPHFWKKTEHGLDMASRQEKTTRFLLEIERRCSELERSGQLPRIWNDARDSAAVPRRHPRAAA